MFKWSAKKADVLLTVSKFSKCEIERHFGIPGDRIHITCNSILPVTNKSETIDLNSEYGLDKYILTVSRIEPRKNHFALLKAFVDLKLKDEGYKLVMVGSKDLNYKEFFNYYAQLDEDIKRNILFMQVPFNHLIALYRNCNLFIFPSFAEGFGIPPIEAIAYGAPLLCSNATAMAEFGLPNEIYFTPNNIEDMKCKITRQLDKPLNPQLYTSKVLSLYNWQRSSDVLYNILMK